MKRLTTLVVLGALAVIAGGPALAQVSPQALQSISIPNKVETPIGPLDFFDGVPSRATAEKVYDNLDRMRGTGCFSTMSVPYRCTACVLAWPMPVPRVPTGLPSSRS